MKLIFVYNADSGLVNAVIDIAHKVISPQTYQCNLCALTYGLVGEKDTWEKFRQESDTEMEFLHKDEFEQQYVRKFDYPVVLKKDKNLDVAISRAELNEIKTLDELIWRVKVVSQMRVNK